MRQRQPRITLDPSNEDLTDIQDVSDTAKRIKATQSPVRTAPVVTRPREFVAQNDDLEAFLDKSTYPQEMDTDWAHEEGVTPAFARMGQIFMIFTEQNNANYADLDEWRKQRLIHAYETVHVETVHCPQQTKSRMNPFILHEDEEQLFTAPKRSRTPSANLEALYGPQQIFTEVFHKRQIQSQEQILVRRMSTFMLQAHVIT